MATAGIIIGNAMSAATLAGRNFLRAARGPLERGRGLAGPRRDPRRRPRGDRPRGGPRVADPQPRPGQVDRPGHPARRLRRRPLRRRQPGRRRQVPARRPRRHRPGDDRHRDRRGHDRRALAVRRRRPCACCRVAAQRAPASSVVEQRAPAPVVEQRAPASVVETPASSYGNLRMWPEPQEWRSSAPPATFACPATTRRPTPATTQQRPSDDPAAGTQRHPAPTRRPTPRPAGSRKRGLTRPWPGSGPPRRRRSATPGASGGRARRTRRGRG